MPVALLDPACPRDRQADSRHTSSRSGSRAHGWVLASSKLGVVHQKRPTDQPTDRPAARPMTPSEKVRTPTSCPAGAPRPSPLFPTRGARQYIRNIPLGVLRDERPTSIALRTDRSPIRATAFTYAPTGPCDAAAAAPTRDANDASLVAGRRRRPEVREGLRRSKRNK